MTTLLRLAAILAYAALSIPLATPLAAAELRIGAATPPTSMDPHWYTSPANSSVNLHVFDTLLRRDPHSVPIPHLAESWRLVDDVTWEFKLRKGVKFHDGTPLTADDVVYSYQRAPNLPNSPSSFAVYTKLIKTITALDDTTVQIVTTGPAAELLNDLCFVMIMSRHATEHLSTADLDSGHGVIGTGPYRFKSWVRGDIITYERNPDYWGEREPWDTVTYRIITNGASRLAALLSGDVDLINDVPSEDIEQVRNNPNLALWTTASTRFVYLALDYTDEGAKSGFLTDLDGKPYTHNPMADPRVRQAMEMAIDLEVIRDRVSQGAGIATGQYLHPGMLGAIPGLAPWKPDPAAAKKLLADAGFPNGFKVTIHTSNDRINNAVRIAQVIGQMWARIGIQAQVEFMPHAVFTPKRFGFPIALSSWGNSAGDAGGTLGPVLHTRDLKRGFGGLNYMRYSNAELDRLTEQSIVTLDPVKREQLYIQATKIALEDRALLPLMVEVNNWATRKPLTYLPRADALTFAMAARRAE